MYLYIIGLRNAVCGTCAGFAAAAPLPWPVAILVALGVGALGGALNGVLGLLNEDFVDLAEEIGAVIERGMALGLELRKGIDMKDPKVQAVLFHQRARAS